MSVHSADLEQARSFLDALDPTGSFTFQTFGERDKSPSLAVILHGDLEAHADRLVSLQQRGAGVFVTVNATDLQGRTQSNVIGIRAVFVDL